MTHQPLPEVPHLAGGNFFDDMRLDISEGHRRLDAVQRELKPRNVTKLRNMVKLWLVRIALRLGIHEVIVTSGIYRTWLDVFRHYWTDLLAGRFILSPMEFFLLLHEYRKRQQHTSPLAWDGAEQHVANWLQPCRLYNLLHGVRMLAVRPIVHPDFWSLLPRKARVLEYGCSLAPYYYCYRRFYSHLECHWDLADLPGFPFHYARYLYWHDPEVTYITIRPTDFADPVGARTDYDVVVVTSVLEHLDDPLFVIQYLLEKLKPGGLLVWDYAPSEGIGLDHPEALRARNECIRIVDAQTEVISGGPVTIDSGANLYIVRKKQN